VAFEANLSKSWDILLSRVMLGSGILFIATISSDGFFLLKLGGYAILYWLFWKFYRHPDFAAMRPVFFSVAPLGVIYLISDISDLVLPSIFEVYHKYFEIAKAVGWVWLGATFIMYRRQMKAMKEEQEIRKKEAKENQLIAARKAVLELLVQERTSELKEQNNKLQETLDELHAAQTQLIHSEKMASLGELTAGIAHEIQNPLNFINNFAELNSELAAEVLEAIETGSLDDAKAIAQDIKNNQEKVVHHGKRADRIVKSMLQHSRGAGSTRELVSLNAMAEECIRLSYQGMRAKEKSFNAKMETSFDEKVGMVEVVPGDISRVLLNICTNAFYAVMQRSKAEMEGYQPTVWMKTGITPGNVWVSIADNGGGISPEVMEKIFQPFFTTKPTGEGTGLGLSMSFDIVTKGHDGEIRVEETEGGGATFIIELPKK
jgi:C4-dicarboxylate-specific signal transduction histidine kinase